MYFLAVERLIFLNATNKTSSREQSKKKVLLRHFDCKDAIYTSKEVPAITKFWLYHLTLLIYTSWASIEFYNLFYKTVSSIEITNFIYVFCTFSLLGKKQESEEKQDD